MTVGAHLQLEAVADANALGLVNEVLPEDDFWPRALEWARAFCPPARASKAVGAIKRAIQTGSDLPLDAGLALERELQQQLFLSSDAREGISAFVHKRVPQFGGR